MVAENLTESRYFESCRRTVINVMGIVMNIRILVVEDSELTRRMIRAVLQTRDWTICGKPKTDSLV
jgi:hypothetical protein